MHMCACVQHACAEHILRSIWKGGFVYEIASFGCSAELQRETYLVLLCSVCTSTVSYPTYRFKKVFLHLSTRASFGVTTVRTFRAETSSLLKLRSFAPWFTLFSDWYLESWLERGNQSVHLRSHFLFSCENEKMLAFSQHGDIFWMRSFMKMPQSCLNRADGPRILS